MVALIFILNESKTTIFTSKFSDFSEYHFDENLLFYKIYFMIAAILKAVLDTKRRRAPSQILG